MTSYLPKIEECFFKYSRQGTILSPKNWLVAEKWEDMGIPINVVCKGIKKACRKFRSAHYAGEERIDVLTYCEPEIFKLWEEFKRATLGAPYQEVVNKESSCDDNRSELKDVISKRLSLIREYLDTQIYNEGDYINIKADGLSKIGWTHELDMIESGYKNNEPDIDAIEERLSALDSSLTKEILNRLPDHLREDIYQTLEEELSPYKKLMDKEDYTKTMELTFLNTLRERLKLRRISLYST